MRQCAISDTWCSDVFLKLKWVCKVSISLGSRKIWSGAGIMIWLALDDDPTILYFGRAWHGRIPPSANLTNFAPRGRSWLRLFSEPAIYRSEISSSRRCQCDISVQWNLTSTIETLNNSPHASGSGSDSGKTPNHEDCCTIIIRALYDNLQNPSEFAGWGQRLLFECTRIGRRRRFAGRSAVRVLWSRLLSPWWAVWMWKSKPWVESFSKSWGSWLLPVCTRIPSSRATCVNCRLRRVNMPPLMWPDQRSESRVYYWKRKSASLVSQLLL